MVCRSLPGRGAVGPGPWGVALGKGGCSAPASLCQLTVNLPSPPPQPQFAFLELGLHQSPPPPLKIQ